MILNEAYNIPTAAPEIDDMPGALNKFREWRGNEALKMADLISFLKSCSQDRDEFLSSFTVAPMVISGRYIVQKLV